MGVFRKREIVDYTLLQKKGFIKKEEDKNLGKVKYSGGYVDFSNSESVQSSSNMPSNEAGVSSFFDNLDKADNALGENILTKDNSDMDNLKVKLEDFEYKLELFIGRLEQIESKVRNFEEKVAKDKLI
ncbi:MAG: hypothetical protein AABX73_02420 [Nanoarchaeota archaeon]